MLDTLALVAVPGIVGAVLWSPVRPISRFRSSFGRLPTARSAIASYLLIAVGRSIPFLIGTGVLFCDDELGGDRFLKCAVEYGTRPHDRITRWAADSRQR
jgi:hypothetical protein